MKTAYGILIGIGVVVVGIIVLVVAMQFSAGVYKNETKEFYVSFIHDFSKRWSIEDVNDMLSNEFLEQIYTPNGQQAMSVFQRLGNFREMADYELRNYHTGTKGKIGVFVCKTTFDNASTIVTVTIVKKEYGLKVMGLNINPLEDISFDNIKTET